MVDEIRNHSDFLHGPYDVVLSEAVKGVEMKWVTEQALKQQAGEAPDKSGACITGAIIHRNEVTVVNVGDCRMVRYIAGQQAVQVRGEEEFRRPVVRLSGCRVVRWSGCQVFKCQVSDVRCQVCGVRCQGSVGALVKTVAETGNEEEVAMASVLWRCAWCFSSATFMPSSSSASSFLPVFDAPHAYYTRFTFTHNQSSLPLMSTSLSSSRSCSPLSSVAGHPGPQAGRRGRTGPHRGRWG